MLMQDQPTHVKNKTQWRRKCIEDENNKSNEEKFLPLQFCNNVEILSLILNLLSELPKSIKCSPLC
jgi:hypothetical protein